MIKYACAFFVSMLTILSMTKQQAKELFGSVKELAKIVGYTTNYFYGLPDPLPVRECDRITGAAIRVGKKIPSDLRRI